MNENYFDYEYNKTKHDINYNGWHNPLLKTNNTIFKTINYCDKIKENELSEENNNMSFVIIGIHEDGVVIASDSTSSNWNDKLNPVIVNNNTKKVFKSNNLIIGAFDDNQYFQNGIKYDLSFLIDSILEKNKNITFFEFIKELDNNLSFENENRNYNFYIGTIENNKTEAFLVNINNKKMNIQNIGRNKDFYSINNRYIREKHRLEQVELLSFEEMIKVADFTVEDVIKYVNDYCSIKAIGGKVQIESLKIIKRV